MATPTRPCPYCGAAVLMNAAACGTCGRPMPPMQAGAPGAAPAKTMFGYAAPAIPGRPGGPAPGQPGYPPGQPGYPPPGGQQPGYPPQGQQPGYPPPGGQQPGGYPPPGGQQPGGYPPPGGQQPGGYPPPGGQQPGARPSQPAAPAGYPPPGQPPNPYGQQPGQAANPYGQPQPQAQAANPYGQPQPQAQAANPYGQPQPQAQAANPYGQQPGQAANPYGQAQPQAQAANPYAAQQQATYPQAPANPYGEQAQTGGAAADFGSKLPSSAPGTIFGFPVSRLRDASLQRKVLFFAGAALVASIAVPFILSPLTFGFSISFFHFLLFPAITGGAYLLVAAAPPHIRQKVPPAVLQWIPFGVSFAGVSMVGGLMATGGGGYSTLGLLAYAVLVFGLLARIAQPQDQIARIIIVIGGAMFIPGMLGAIGPAFSFSGGVLNILLNLLNLVVNIIGVACILFFFPPQKLPPALRSIDALGPLFAAVLILWLPLQVILAMLYGLIFTPFGISAITIYAHVLLRFFAYFGVVLMAAPAAYEEAMRMFGKGPPPAAGGTPQGGGYPPQGGGYPPQGGGYPPQGGGYPPQGGGYPPQGGGYPPQGGGGQGWQ